CAVTEEAVRKSRKLLRRAQRENPGARLVMSGCYASLDPERAAADLGVDLVVPNPDKERLVEIARRELSLPTMPATAMDPAEYSLLAHNRQRAFIKVQDGCRYRCSYCIVTLARGDERSRSIDDVVADIERQHATGIQEVVLAGVHLGGYGSDCGSNLQRLVEAVLERTRIPRLRLGSLEPWDLPSDFWSLFENSRLMPHLHLPMQSGADSVLRRMSRRCRSGEFLELIEAGRSAVPELNVTTDIIVGFPGETEAEWQQTLAFVEKAGFGDIHIFAFSPRSETKAAGLPDQVSREVKRRRSEELHALASRLRKKRLREQLGKRFTLLVEGRRERTEKAPCWEGYAPNYLRVRFESEQTMENRLVDVEVTA
ncbi:MAG TPA: MiaB/RimO family radical SAM methylthiotransferase, partial [Chromatiaceae bacterium]|nr:MiaB/RimO family radical SAM methylthiotransferase [Chromatiaceae bacterium]